MQDLMQSHPVLMKLENHGIFRLELLRVAKGQPVYLGGDFYEETKVIKPFCVARLTELCDEYYEADLTADDLLCLAQELEQVAKAMQRIDQQDHFEAHDTTVNSDSIAHNLPLSPRF